MKKSSIFFAVALAALGFAVSPIHAVIVNGSSVTVDFEDFYAGTLVGYSNTYQNTHLQRYTSDNNANLAPGTGFTVRIDNNCGPDVGALYDTDRRTYLDYKYYGASETRIYDKVDAVQSNSQGSAGYGEDPDLEYDSTGGWSGGWNGGNLKNERLGNALIIQEHATWNNIADGHLYYTQGQHYEKYNKYAPDDSAYGGYMKFTFETDINSFGFDFIDLDCGYCSGEHASITFYDFNTNRHVSVNFSEFSHGAFSNRDANVTGNVVWGDGKANRIDSISVAELNEVMGTNLTSFSAVKIRTSGSGAVAGIRYHYTPIPEASTVLAGGLIFLALAGIQVMRIRRRARSEG